MALRECPECRAQVSDQASSCPHCGMKLKPKQKLTFKHYVILAVAVLLAVAFLQARHPKTLGSPAQQPPSAQQEDKILAKLKQRVDKQLSAGDVVPTSAARMYNEYSANEVSADAKYKGKWVQVKGRVDSVSKDITGDPYVALAADEYGTAQVHAALYDVQIKSTKGPTACSALDKAAALKKGQSVIVEGLARGATLGIPRLEQCLIVDAK